MCDVADQWGTSLLDEIAQFPDASYVDESHAAGTYVWGMQSEPPTFPIFSHGINTSQERSENHLSVRGITD